MPVSKTSYETTFGSIFPSHKLEAALKEALVSSSLSTQNMGVSPFKEAHLVFVAGLEPSESQIPSFNHPYLIENFKGRSYLVADVRPFKNSSANYLDGKTFEQSVKNKTEYMLTKNRAILELRWIAGDQSSLRSKFSFAGNVFAAWISQSVSKVYGLDFNDQRVLMAIALYYYHTLFSNQAKLEEKALDIAVIHTIKATRLSEKEVMEVFTEMPEIHSVNDLCEAVKAILKNIRLQDFNLTMLLSVINNTWYGNNARDMISIAIEHPPTWIAIVFAAMTEKTYKSCQIYRLIESQARSGNVSEFKLNYLDEIQSQSQGFATESIDDVVFRDF